MTEYRHTDVSRALPHLMAAVMETGDEQPSRAGRVREILHPHIVLTQPWRREVLTPGRKASLPAQIAETMWVLAGRDDVEWLARYLPRAVDFSDDGKVWRGAYGKRLRVWKGTGDYLDPITIDQLAFVVDLLRKDPGSRRAVMTIYDPAIDSADGKDIPCNNWLHFQIRDGKLYLHVVIRSNDLMWGWSGINAFEWSALQEIVAGLLGVGVGELHFSISNLHLYERHWDKAAKIANMPGLVLPVEPSPRFKIDGGIGALTEFNMLVDRWFEIEAGIRTGSHPAPWMLISEFPEPMMRSWLRVIAWWWTQEERWVDDLRGTPLYAAAMQTPKKETVLQAPADPFADYLVNLHAEKNAVYGTSWKKRGEQISILANIARKVDRLGVGGAGDTAADTVVDLLVYLVKYRLWLYHPDDDSVEPVSNALRTAVREKRYLGTEDIPYLVKQFDKLEKVVQGSDPGRGKTLAILNSMIPEAAAVARGLWESEKRGLATA